MEDKEKAKLQEEVRQLLKKLDSPAERARVEKLTRANIQKAEEEDARIFRCSRRFFNRGMIR